MMPLSSSAKSTRKGYHQVGRISQASQRNNGHSSCQVLNQSFALKGKTNANRDPENRRLSQFALHVDN